MVAVSDKPVASATELKGFDLFFQNSASAARQFAHYVEACLIRCLLAIGVLAV
jgi:hypothetical protein